MAAVGVSRAAIAGFDSAPGQWHTLTMWQLTMQTPADKDFMPVGTFATVTEAARRIAELEGTPKNGLFLKFYVETNEFGTDDEAFRVFHYTGKRALYGIKRSWPN
jgi:hypothetical protein